MRSTYFQILSLASVLVIQVHSAPIKDLINNWEHKAEFSGSPITRIRHDKLPGQFDDWISPKEPRDLCLDASPDLMVRLANGELLVFKANYYWQLLDRKLTDPRPIASDWPGLPGHLSAAFTIDKVTYFLKGDRVWMFDEQHKPVAVDGHLAPSRLLSLFPDFTSRLGRYQTATYWPTTNEIIFFLPDKLLIYGVDTRETKELARDMVSGLASGVLSAAYLDSDNHFVYFFPRRNLLVIGDGH